MLRVISKMQDLPFRPLTDVYAQSIEDAARQNYPGREDGLLQAEMDLYSYLRDVFFKIPGARLYLWEEAGRILCALRMEPYKDGMLLTALETHPEYRKMGYAQKLIQAVLDSMQTPAYSHIRRDNKASISVHQKCGFEKITNYAVYLDGSVSQKADTYCRKYVKSSQIVHKHSDKRFHQ